MTKSFSHQSPAAILHAVSEAGQRPDLSMPDLTRGVPAPATAAACYVDSHSNLSAISVMAALENEFPAWCDDLVLITADMMELTALGAASLAAPHSFLAGLAAGRLIERLDCREVTGRGRNYELTGSLDGRYFSDIAALETAHAGWFEDCTAAESDLTTPPGVLMTLADAAPHPFLAGQLYGRLVERLDRYEFTGRRPN